MLSPVGCARYPADFAADKLLVIHTDKGGEISIADTLADCAPFVEQGFAEGAITEAGLQIATTQSLCGNRSRNLRIKLDKDKAPAAFHPIRCDTRCARACERVQHQVPFSCRLPDKSFYDLCRFGECKHLVPK